MYTSVMVNDQAKALKFYTEVLGFFKKMDLPAGEARWLTVVSPEGSADIQMLLEPTGHPASKIYQKALFDDGDTLDLICFRGYSEGVRKTEEAGCSLSHGADKNGTGNSRRIRRYVRQPHSAGADITAKYERPRLRRTSGEHG